MSSTISLRSCAFAALVGLAACGGSTGIPAFDPTPVPFADPGSTLPDGWQRGAFAEIYVRGYQDSNGDGIGDLRGLISRLDYLRELGVTGLWLMPIQRSADRDHGYAVADYRDVEPDYGTLADLDELLAQAHARGIGVILDYVINHSASTHPAFLASRSKTSALRGWYVWQDTRPTGWSIYGNDPWRALAGGYYFAPFADIMPDWNLREPSVVAYHHDNLRFWLNRGVDGFRFDAVGNLVENGPSAWEAQPENHAILGDARALIASYARRYLVCEAPADPAAFNRPTSCGSAFAFGHQGDVISAARGDGGAIRAVADYFRSASLELATFASNHDSFAGPRLHDQLAGDAAQYKLAAATYLLQPGTPFIYYGEEIGMAGGRESGDHGLRTPMSWTSDARTAGFTTGAPFRGLSANVASHNVAAQDRDPGSILAFYRAMLGLRRTRGSLARGGYEAPSVDGQVLSFRRVDGAERTLVVINYGTGARTVAIGGLPASATFEPLYPAGGGALVASGAGELSVAIGGQAVAVFAQR